MTNSRSISFGSGGIYNENIQVQGDVVYGDKNQSSTIQGNKIISQDLNQAVIDIQQLLHEYQGQYSPTEAQQRTASELANQAKKNAGVRRTLTNLVRYIATNGGIEAGIGKVIELALKLVGA